MTVLSFCPYLDGYVHTYMTWLWVGFKTTIIVLLADYILSVVASFKISMVYSKRRNSSKAADACTIVAGCYHASIHGTIRYQCIANPLTYIEGTLLNSHATL